MCEGKAVEKASSAFGAAGLKLKAGRFFSFSVRKALTTEKLIQELSVHNCYPDVASSEFANEIRVVSLGDSRKEVDNVVLQVSGRVRLWWRAQGCVDLKWQSYKVHELLGVELCYKCGGHGHLDNKCEQPEKLCFRCGVAGQTKLMCTAATDAQKNYLHSVYSMDCPFYKRAVERAHNRRNAE